MPIRYVKPFVPFFTASYTLKADQPDHPGRFYTAAGSGALTFTLPAPVLALVGYVYEFLNAVGQNMIVSAGATNGISFNNSSCTSLAAQTASQLIGARIRATCVQTGATTFKWFLEGTTVGVTYTVT